MSEVVATMSKHHMANIKNKPVSLAKSLPRLLLCDPAVHLCASGAHCGAVVLHTCLIGFQRLAGMEFLESE